MAFDVSPIHPDEASRLDVEELLRRLGGSPAGLTKREAAARLAGVGENTVARERPIGPVRRLVKLFFSPLPILLLMLAIVAEMTGEVRGAIVIAAIVVVSVLLSWFQETRSSRAAERLRALVHTTATVMRRDRRRGEQRPTADGKLAEIPLSRIVPGDVVHLGAGDLVPADVRLISAKDLFIDQAMLTGESMPAEKSDAAVRAGRTASVLDLANIGFMGTHVVSGSAIAVVFATGPRSYFGSVASATAGQRETTSFDRGVSRFTWLMIRFMLVMVPLVFVINGLSKGH